MRNFAQIFQFKFKSKMNRQFFIVMLAAIFMASPAVAQEDNSVSGTVSKIWNNTKKKVRNSTRSVKEEFNINDAAADLREIDGHKYMLLYRKDNFRDDAAQEFKDRCLQEFKDKYPEVTVLNCVIPQDQWIDTTSRSATGKVTRYVKTIFCYILAKDGPDGYINARFSYRQLKKVGGKWKNDKSNWPNWERTDVMTPDVYKQLKELSN